MSGESKKGLSTIAILVFAAGFAAVCYFFPVN